MTFVVADRVRDTSTTEGTGTISVSGVPPMTYQTFSGVCAVSDTLSVFIQHRTQDEWEVVNPATYSAGNQISRSATNVIDGSSGPGVLVNFSAGTKDVVLGGPARNNYCRELLVAARTYFLRTDGNDANTGLADTAAGAKLTFDGVVDVLSGEIDFGGQIVTVEVENTTWTSQFALNRPWVGGGELVIDFNGATISPTSADCFIHTANGAGKVTIRNATMEATAGTGGTCISHYGAGSQLDIDSINFGAVDAGGFHMIENAPGGVMNVGGTYDVSGNANIHIFCRGTGSNLYYYPTAVTLTGSPIFSAAFAYAQSLAYIETFAPSITGATGAVSKRYQATANGVIQTFAGGANIFPGDTAGTTATGGQYL